jgi:hypothetical protein
MDETCGTDGGKKCIETFGGNLKEKHHFEDLCLGVKIILKWILKNQVGWA